MTTVIVFATLLNAGAKRRRKLIALASLEWLHPLQRRPCWSSFVKHLRSVATSKAATSLSSCGGRTDTERLAELAEQLLTSKVDLILAWGTPPVAAVTLLADPMFISQRDRTANLALKHRLPSALARRENVDAGGLLAYGPSLADQVRRAATFVDRIFRGTKAAAGGVRRRRRK